METDQADDPVLTAMSQLIAVLERIEREKSAIVVQFETIHAQRRLGVAYTEIVPREPRPLIVERTREVINEMIEASGRLQRAEAKALHDEGASMERIGELFGVTRQRVADFLRSDPPSANREPIVSQPRSRRTT